MTEKLEDKTCAWKILNQSNPDCQNCQDYNSCPDYIPLEESQPERVDRIMRNLYKERKPQK